MPPKKLTHLEKPAKKIWQPGDHYPDWEKLEPFANKSEIHSGQLIVRIKDDRGRLEKGTICEVIEISNYKFKINPSTDNHSYRWFAPLPESVPTKSSTPKPVANIIQRKKIRFSDSEIIHSEDGLEIKGEIFTIDQAKEKLRELRRAILRHGKLKF